MIFKAQQLDADEFERRFINMGAQQFDLMNESARQRYVQILDDMFHDRTITWGRLVMVRHNSHPKLPRYPDGVMGLYCYCFRRAFGHPIFRESP